jgi:AraC-like DNA-binding protein
MIQIPVSSLFLFFSTVFSFVLFLGEILSNRTRERNLLLAWIFFFVGFFEFHAFLFSSKLIYNYPHLFLCHLPFSVLLGPFLERYLIFIWENTLEPMKIFIFKCLVSLLILIVGLPIYILTTEEKMVFLVGTLENRIPFQVKIIIVLSLLSILYFSAKLLFHFVRLFRIEILKNSASLRMILIVLALLVLSVFIGFYFTLTKHGGGATINAHLIGIFLIFLYIERRQNPEIFNEIRRIVEEEKKYKTSQLKSLDIKELEIKFNKLFKEEKIYREDEISLSSLASELEISTHQLSEFLNQELGLSFFQILNKFRIEEAKEKLISNPNETILSIAYSVGFQSKSTFNEIFKKETGQTPTEFRKIKKKSPD